MRKRKFSLRRLIPVAVVLVLITAMAVVSGSNITSSDPLVTLSYLNGTYKQQILQDVQTAMGSRASQLEAVLNQRIAAFQRTSGTSGAAATTHSAVSIPANGSYVVPAYGEFLFLSGAATAKAAGLTDLTAGTAVAIGESLQVNHLYSATTSVAIQTTETARILIRR